MIYNGVLLKNFQLRSTSINRRSSYWSKNYNQEAVRVKSHQVLTNTVLSFVNSTGNCQYMNLRIVSEVVPVFSANAFATAFLAHLILYFLE